MTWTLAQSGTFDPATTAEEVVTTADTTNGTYVFQIDAAALTNGNTLKVNIYEKVLAGGTSRVIYSGAWRHAQGQPVKASIPVVSDVEIVVKASCSDAALTFPWKLLRG
jgi:hypothetical protein